MIASALHTWKRGSSGFIRAPASMRKSVPPAFEGTAHFGISIKLRRW
jgi:hypothetical protein